MAMRKERLPLTLHDRWGREGFMGGYDHRGERYICECERCNNNRAEWLVKNDLVYGPQLWRTVLEEGEKTASWVQQSLSLMARIGNKKAFTVHLSDEMAAMIDHKRKEWDLKSRGEVGVGVHKNFQRPVQTDQQVSKSP